MKKTNKGRRALRHAFRKLDRHFDWYWAEWLIGLAFAALVVDALILCAIVFSWAYPSGTADSGGPVLWSIAS